jgi:hypothetical protein
MKNTKKVLESYEGHEHPGIIHSLVMGFRQVCLFSPSGTQEVKTAVR